MRDKKNLQERSYRVLRGLYDNLEVGVETEFGDMRLGKLVGLTKATVADHRRVFCDLGILTIRMHHGTRGERTRRQWGTWAMWTVNMDLAAAYRTLDKHYAAGGASTIRVLNPGAKSKAKPNGSSFAPIVAELDRLYALDEKANAVIIGTVETGETIAIAGPEPKQPLAALAPARKDEGAALIEAARQYLDRDKTVLAAIKAIEDLGIEVDHTAIIAAVKLPVDERLAAVALVVPYVTRMERENARLANEANDREITVKALRKELEPLRREVTTLKAAQRRLVEDRVREKVNGSTAHV